AAGAAGRTVTFADGSAADFDAVVWATGFRAEHTWNDIPDVNDELCRIRHQRGVTPSPGLYMLGLTWQHTRGSALLGWVGRDAAFLAGPIARRWTDEEAGSEAAPPACDRNGGQSRPPPGRREAAPAMTPTTTPANT